MPKLNPLFTLFLAIAAMNIGLFGWQRADMSDLEARISSLEIRIEERFAALETRIETRFTALETRLSRIEAGQTELRERMARIEGTVAGALVHLAQAPTEETAN